VNNESVWLASDSWAPSACADCRETGLFGRTIHSHRRSPSGRADRRRSLYPGPSWR